MAVERDITWNIRHFQGALRCDRNFDVVYRVFRICGREACMFFVDGFAKDEIMEKLLEFFYGIQDEDLLRDAHTFSKSCVPYCEVAISGEEDTIVGQILSGVWAVFVDGMDQCVLIDQRTYPQRTTSEPDQDKSFRGSRDGFVETMVFNAALIRRRIRSPRLCVEHLEVGETSRTDVAVCYFEGRADPELVNTVRERIAQARVDALTMNQESLAELLVRKRWYNPFPKFKFTERPDAAAAQILEGDVVVLVDNSASALLLPTTILRFNEEINDYYFPPLIGTYLQIIRTLVLLLTMFITPLWYLLVKNPDTLHENLRFLLVQDEYYVPLIVQLLLVELIIDILKIASLNTPDVLSNSFSMLGALILGDFAVQARWLVPEVLVYMAFVAVANYAQHSYEMGYATKLCRMLLLVLIWLWDWWGFAAGIVITLMLIVTAKPLVGKGYLYPLIPFDRKKLARLLYRRPVTKKNS